MKAKKRRDAAWYCLFVLPLVIIFSIIVVIPFIIGIVYSFFKWDGLPMNPKIFEGFSNYIRLFSDERFYVICPAYNYIYSSGSAFN